MSSLVIGKFGSPFKLKGDLHFFIYGNCSDFVPGFDLFVKEKDVKLDTFSNSSSHSYWSNLSSFRLDDLLRLPPFSLKENSNKYLISFKEHFKSIEEIYPLKTIFAYALKKDLINLNPFEFYYHDLVGLDAFFSDIPLGKVARISNFGAGDLCQIEKNYINKKKKPKKKVIFIPFSKNFIKDIDFEKKIIQFTSVEDFL